MRVGNRRESSAPSEARPDEPGPALPARALVRRVVARRPGAVVALSYVVAGVGALGRSIRPGRTLVPADILTIVNPYASLPGAHPAHNLLLSDVTFLFYPWFHFLSQALHHAHVPQWNPALLGGVVVTPNGYVSPYYPPTWLAAVLSPFDAYNLFVLVHLVVGALGVYAFSRVVGARRLPAWVAGLGVFAAAFWVHWSVHVVHLTAFVLLPWALAAAHRLVEAPSRRRVAALAVVYGLWWLGGNPQYVYDGTLLLVAYAGALVVVRRVQGTGTLPAPVLGAAAALALGVALAAPVVLPTARASSRISRVHEDVPQAHVPRSEVIRVLVPDATGSPPDHELYGSNDELRMDSPFFGVAAFLLAAAAVGGRRDPVRLILFAAVAVVVVLAYTTQAHAVPYAVLPGYDRFRAVTARWLSVLPALALPLAALGLDDVLGGRRRSRAVLAGAAGVSLAAVAAWLAWELSKPDAPTSFFAGRAAVASALIVVVAVAAWLAHRRPAVAVTALVLCVGFEIAVNTSRWYPSVVERTAYPNTPVSVVVAQRGGRTARVGPRTMFTAYAPDVPMMRDELDIDGVDSFFPSSYDRYRRIIDDYGGFAQTFNATPALGDPAALSSPLLDALDVRTVVADKGVAVPPGYPVVSAGAPTAYARSSPGPAVVVARARPATDAQAWAAVADPGWKPADTAAVVGLGRPVDGGPGRVSGGSRGTDGERWDVDAPAGGFLRVSAGWDEGWTARVDGRSTPVLRADAIFRGVVVAPGHHRVEFSYRNPAEGDGRWVGLAALLVLLALALPFRGRRRAAAAPAASPSPPVPPPAAGGR